MIILYLSLGFILLVIIGALLNKPDRRFDNLIKEIDEKIKESEEDLKRAKQKYTRGMQTLTKDVLSGLYDWKRCWIAVREGYTVLSEKYRYNKIKYKQIQIDWNTYVGLMEKMMERINHPDPREKDNQEADLARIRMLEIEKRLTEGISNKAKPTIQEIKKAAHDVLEYLH